MKLTELRISVVNQFRAPDPDKNPLRAVVKLNADHSTIECVLSEETMLKMLDLCADEIAANAKRNVDEFVASVTAFEGSKSTALLAEPTAAQTELRDGVEA